MIEADKRKAIYLLDQEGMSAREISRRLGISRNTIGVILGQNGEMPVLERKKQQIDEDLLRRLYDECDGYAQRVHEKLTEEEGVTVTYPTLTVGGRGNRWGLWMGLSDWAMDEGAESGS